MAILIFNFKMREWYRDLTNYEYMNYTLNIKRNRLCLVVKDYTV